VTPDQWFQFWMTLISTVGGGLVTLGGVALGFLFARRSDKHRRWNAELQYWTNELGAVYRRLLEADPKTEQEAYDAIGATVRELVHAHESHPSPRGSVGDALMAPLFMAIGAAAGIVPSPNPAEVVEETPGVPEPGSNYLGSIPTWKRLLKSTLELAQTWSNDGLSQRKIARAEKTRIGQIGTYHRVPDDRKRVRRPSTAVGSDHRSPLTAVIVWPVFSAWR
jgi:hypothetical protein